jgi:DHA3 family multidrug efflux protein-like MFS transporter
MSVQTWGVVGAIASLFTIIGGLIIAHTGVGSEPVRLLLVINVALWVFTLFPCSDRCCG